MFANAQIPDGTIIGEYLGELVPNDTFRPGDQYGFDYLVAGCTAHRFGNITRFVNHHCRPNLTVEQGMYGKRLVMFLKADGNIAVDQQVFINYGEDYFRTLNIQCMCDDKAGDHLPPPDPAAKKAAAKKGAAKKGAAKKGAAKAMAKKTGAKKAAGKKAAGKKIAGGKLAKAAGVKR